MAIKFEFYESPNTIGTRKKRYHARVVNWQRINTDYQAREIQYGSSLTVADIKATIISLSEKLAYYLKDGARVHIEGIGYFHISLTCPETRTPSSTRANKVKFKSVTFRADKYLKHQLSDVKTERSKYKPHSMPVTKESIDEALTEYFLTNSVLTRRKFESLCGLTRATAGRYIAQLAKDKKLQISPFRATPSMNRCRDSTEREIARTGERNGKRIGNKRHGPDNKVNIQRNNIMKTSTNEAQTIKS